VAAAIFGPTLAQLSRELFPGYVFAGCYGVMVFLYGAIIALLPLTRIPSLSRAERRDSGRPLPVILRQPATAVARAMVTALLGRVEVAAALPAVAAGPEGAALLWCIPFRHLLAFYQSFGFTDAALPWPAPIARKAAALIAQEQAIAVLALHRRHGRQVDPAAGDGAVAA